jgi:F-type H+-transporting ATPase subunit a
MELPKAIAGILIPMIWVIELFGLLVKHFVLAVRLFANLLAGHMVIGAILGFIAVVSPLENPLLFGTITVASIGGQIFIGLLELFVAFLQAYVFAFLATLFISAAVHPH